MALTYRELVKQEERMSTQSIHETPAKFIGEYPKGVFNRDYVEHIEAELRQCRADLAKALIERDEYKASFKVLWDEQPLAKAAK